jgi:hypothetical protein
VGNFIDFEEAEALATIEDLAEMLGLRRRRSAVPVRFTAGKTPRYQPGRSFQSAARTACFIVRRARAAETESAWLRTAWRCRSARRGLLHRRTVR